MNGFKGGVTIDSFDLPANDPAGGVSLTLATTLVNPASVGVALSTIGFQNSFGSTIIGPAASTGAFTLLPKSTIQLPLAGRLIAQTTPLGLQDVSTIFNGNQPNFCHLTAGAYYACLPQASFTEFLRSSSCTATRRDPPT